MLNSLGAVELARFLSRHPIGRLLTMPLAATMFGCATPAPSPSNVPAASAREDIYVLRSLREERTPKSTWCTSERAGFAPFNSEFLLDDRFAMWSMRAQPQDGRITDAKVNRVGELRTCIGLTGDPKVFNFYAEGQMAGLSVTGNGDCLLVRPDYPEKGIATLRCYLNLRGLPSPYVGGLLTTNTLTSRAVLSGDSEPPGYVQTSIATIRLWRAP